MEMWECTTGLIHDVINGDWFYKQTTTPQGGSQASKLFVENDMGWHIDECDRCLQSCKTCMFELSHKA